jgi:branched-chain amino acid transport system ATP-binding protein
MPRIEVRGLTAGYGQLPVVRDLSLSVASGEVVALLGPNGAGKTTTLRAIVGEIRRTAGEVTWDGAPYRGPVHRHAKKGLRYISEDRVVLMGLTVAENLRLSQGAVSRAYELFPALKQLANRRVGQLSGGEQQMLALGRALCGDAKLFIADEISLGLGPIVVTRLLDSVRRAADDGAAVLLVEQHVRTALRVADRAYVMRRGQIVLEGTADFVLDRYADIESAYLAGTD